MERSFSWAGSKDGYPHPWIAPCTGSPASEELQSPPDSQSCASFLLSQKEGCFDSQVQAGSVGLFAGELAGTDVHTVAVGTQASLEKAA